MKAIVRHIVGTMLIIWASTSQGMTVWVVESGQDPFSSSQSELTINDGTTTLDLYYDVEGDISYGYDFILDINGIGSIANVGGGDSDLGDIYGSGWRQFGGDIFGETGSSVLAYSFDLTADTGTTLLVSGSYTDSNFFDAPIISSTLVNVSAVPVPAAAWLFWSGFLCLIGAARKKRIN